MTPKQIVFFILIFVMILLTNLVSDFISEKLPKIPKLLNLIGCALLFTLILLVVFLNKSSGLNEHYQKDGFHFEVTPPKLCDGGPYMTQSGSANHEYCQNLLSTPEGVKKYDTYNCANPMYMGRPGNFGDWTPISDGNWKNQRCTTPMSPGDRPMVL